MARIRSLKPEFFDDEQLAAVSPDPNVSRAARLLFEGLWCQADKRGRLEDRPARLRARIFPYDRDIDAPRVDELLGLLEAGGFVLRYHVDGAAYLLVRSFERHQHVHPHEPESRLPGPPQDDPRHVPIPARVGTGTCLGTDNVGTGTCLVPASTVPGHVPVPDPPGGYLVLEGSTSLSQEPRAREERPGVRSAVGSAEDVEAERAGAFVRWYAEEAYPRLRNRPYVLKPVRDFDNARPLVRAYADDGRLRLLAEFYLTCDHRDAQKGSRTIGQFAALVSWCDEQLTGPPAARIGPVTGTGPPGAAPQDGGLAALWAVFKDQFARATDARTTHELLRFCRFVADEGSGERVVLLVPSEEVAALIRRRYADALQAAATAIDRVIQWQPADEVAA